MVVSDVEKFVRRENVDRYRRLLDAARMKGEDTGRLESLLAREQQKQRDAGDPIESDAPRLVPHQGETEPSTTGEAEMNMLARQQHLERYRHELDNVRDPATRLRLLKLLEEEEAKEPPQPLRLKAE
ncbi:MAG: hypothetical protein ACXWC0_26040 [Burkholderiales bacterium]